MVRLICLILVASMTISGCARISESRFNPFNLFRGGDGEAAQAAPVNVRPIVPEDRVVQTVDARPLVAQVTELEITPTIGGVVVRAQGTATASGAFSAELTTAGFDATQITLDMRAFQGGGPGTGTISVARFFSDAELGGARVISVRSASNTLSRRR